MHLPKLRDTQGIAQSIFCICSDNGIHLAPSQFEAMFLSVAHTDAVLEETLDKVRAFFVK